LRFLLLLPLLTAAAFVYGRQRLIPPALIASLLPATLLEITLYASLAVPALGEPLSALKPRTLAALLLASALAPWLLYPGHNAPLLLLAITVPVAFWYIVFKPTAAADVALLLFLPAVVLLKGRLFREIFPDPLPGLRLDFLGQLLWIRLAIGVMVLLRRVEGIGFGFVPTASEWRIGAKYFLQAMSAGLLAAYALGVLKAGTPNVPFWILPFYAAGVFLGIFAVVACSEEFFLRGIVLGRLLLVLKNETAALLIVSCISGAVHLFFRHAFNWKFALLSAIVHFFFGRAYLEAGGIRAGMVAHALTVTAWITLFAKSG
jgi:hypothetical protein